MANQLTDPKPEFVSLVGHGANQTPYRALKSEVADLRGAEIQEEEMRNQAEVQKMTFSSERFADAKAVEEYLDEKGYSDFTVSKTRKGFEVVAKDEKDFVGELKKIQADEGVLFYVGKLAEGKNKLDTTKEQKKAKAEKVLKIGELSADEVAKKYYDYCCSGWEPPQGKTVAEVLSEQYNDGTFPGLWQINDAFWFAIYNLVKAGDNEGVRSACTELGNLIVSILSALETAGVDTKAVKELLLKQPEKETDMSNEKKDNAPAGGAEAEKATKSEAPAEQEQKAEHEAEKAADKEQDTAAKAGENGKETKAEEKDSGAEEAQKSDAPDMVALMAQAVEKAMSPVSEAIAKMQGDISELQKATKDGLADLDDKVSKTGERVSELETARQTRKSADANGLDSGTQGSDGETVEETKAQKAYQDRLDRDRMGFL